MAVIVAAGLIALSPSIIGNAQAQMYTNDYGYDNSYYPKAKSSHTDIQKIKCVNSNINVNGIDITQIPQDPNALEASGNEGTSDAANTPNGNGHADRINFERNLVNICVNVNSNDQLKVSPPEAILGVKKTIICFPDDSTEAGQACQRIQTEITPDEFNILVTGNNLNPSAFAGSTPRVIIALGPGNYEVSETVDASVEQTISNIESNLGVLTKGPALVPSLSSDCTFTNEGTARGTIEEGESQNCDIENRIFVVEQQ